MFKLIKKCSGIIQATNAFPFAGKIVKCNTRKFSISKPFFNACDSVIKEPNIEAITNGDPELEHKIKVLILETEVMRQDGKNVPSSMKDEQWKELLNLESRSARRKYLDFLFKIEMKKENEKIKKEQRKKLRDETIIEPLIEGAMRYDLGHNHILLRVYDTTINQLFNNNLIQAMQFSEKIVVDCGYYNNMSKRENINCAKQLNFLFSDNRAHKDPYDVHFCNAHPDSVLMDYLHRHIPPMYEDWFPMNFHEESYLDLFNKDELVYLTPHCREEMTEYDHNAVYIIGAIVDKINNEPLSLAKAKKEGLRMAKLPLDRYLNWGSGSGKSLTLNHMISVMLDIRMTGDWEYALRHVPKRKLVETQMAAMEKKFSTPFKHEEPKKYSSWKPAVQRNKDERLVKMRSILYE